MTETRAAPRWVGRPLKRVEDPRLLRGRGQFIEDLAPLPHIHHAALLRSPHAHARIVHLDTAAARTGRGVVAVLTGRDIVASLSPLPVGVPRVSQG